MGWLSSVLAVAVLLGGCAPRVAGSVSRQEPSTVAPKGALGRFTNQELLEELRKRGFDVAPPDAGPADRPGGVPATPGQASPPRTPPRATPTALARETARGVVVTLSNIQFGFDRSDLRPEARQLVERLAGVLNDSRAATRKVVLEGHADAIGTEPYNLALSHRRAEAVAQELIANGVRRDRLTVLAHGERYPVAANLKPDGSDNPEGRAVNRRVEAVIQD